VKKNDLIKVAFEKSKLQVREFADKAGVSVTTMSNALNDGPVSIKVLDASLRAADIDLEDCLVVPPKDDSEKQERKLTDCYRLLSPKDKGAIIGVAESLAEKKALGQKQSAKAGKR
jgi:transcriptional regulator with XRE-family HTH domain